MCKRHVRGGWLLCSSLSEWVFCNRGKMEQQEDGVVKP